MEKQFENICRKFGNPQKCATAFAEIVAQYRVPERFYHTFHGHIIFCISELEKVPAEMISEKEAVTMSLFLHDIIMDFSRSDNEKSSAEFAEEFCHELEMPSRFGKKVAELTIATKHDATPKDRDAQIVIDIDLAILGQDKETFDAYEINIRREYAYVPEEVFKRERAKILKKFLDRPSIFLTEYFRQKYEDQARKNLRRSIGQLEA
jgi:predicted metal-dependent HD superfamily phosphohydrolase